MDALQEAGRISSNGDDERGANAANVGERLYRESGHTLYQSSAYLLDGRVEQDPRRGFSFVVDRIEDLNGALERARSRTDARPRPGKARRAG